MAPARTVDPKTGEIEKDAFAPNEEYQPQDGETYNPPAAAASSDGYDDLLAQVDRDIVGWRPKASDTVFGVVVDVSEGESEFGTYPLLVIDSPLYEQLVGVHCFHQTLKRDVLARLDRGTIRIGSQVAVSYRGEGTAAGGKSAPNLYRIAVKPPAAQ